MLHGAGDVCVFGFRRFEGDSAAALSLDRLLRTRCRSKLRHIQQFTRCTPRPQPPENGTQSHEAHDAELDDYLHIALSNRGVLMTPFHNMALMSPATGVADVATHLWAFEEAVVALTA